jgi:predicted HAD superfamily Cof-like phosphohydrolase
LITEELSEYCKAVANQDIVAIADGLGDLMYVVIGTAIEHGLPFDKVFDLIHKSNMSKKGGHFDKSKKWIKPPTYKPVDLSWLKKICK